jgi:hypothetical protein
MKKTETKRFIYRDLRENVVILELEDSSREEADRVFQSCTRIDPSNPVIKVEVKEIEVRQAA